jgi:hypothetical protein
MTDLRTLARESQNKLKTAVERTATQPTLPDIRDHGRTADLTAPVGVAWANVMADVLWVGKEYVQELRYQVRGIDAVLNVVGPVLRKHGVSVVPVSVQPTYSLVETRGKDGNVRRMNRCQVTVRYSVLGPTGDVLPVTLESAGEAINSGDKSTAGAMTVALRTLYINALAIPTNRPEDDPEYTVHELAAPKPPEPGDYYREIVNPRTSLARLRQIRAEFADHPDIAHAEVEEDDGTITLAKLLTKVGKERAAQEGTS